MGVDLAVHEIASRTGSWKLSAAVILPQVAPREALHLRGPSFLHHAVGAVSRTVSPVGQGGVRMRPDENSEEDVPRMSVSY